MMMQHKDKNIRFKHVKYIKNSTQTKLNFSGTHKLMLTSHNTHNNTNVNKTKMFSPKSKHFNSSSNIIKQHNQQTANTNMNNVFRNYSPSQGITSLYSLNKQTNVFKHNTHVTNNNNSNSNNTCYQVTKTTPNSPNNTSSKTKAITNIHKYNRNDHHHNLTNPTLTHYIKTKKPSLMITTNPSSALRSSTSSFSQGNRVNSVTNSTATHNNQITTTTTKRKYTSKKPRNKINNINTYFHISSHKSQDFLSAQLSPSSSIRKFHNENTANTAALTTNINQLSTKENSITLNNKVRTTIKTSLYTDYCTNTIKDIHDIETPEDLHFFYVSVVQNGKLVEVKFEVEPTNNNNNN